jgi:hypothetical protein
MSSKFNYPEWRTDIFREIMSAAQSRMTAINSKRQVPQNKHLPERRFIPQKDLNRRHPSQTRILLQLVDFLLAKVIMQSAHANHITTLRIKQIPRYRTRNPTCGSGYSFQFRVQLHPSEDTLWQLCMSIKTKLTFLENYRCASRGDLIPFWSFKLKKIPRLSPPANYIDRATVFCRRS